MKPYVVKTPKFVQRLFPKRVWAFPHAHNSVFLTFDDGPIPEVTPWVLDMLKKYKAKGTFFCIGDNVRKHPELFKRIFSEGHAIGNHTFNHLKGSKTITAAYVDNVLKAEEEMNKTLVQRPKSEVGSPSTFTEVSVDKRLEIKSNEQNSINLDSIRKPAPSAVEESYFVNLPRAQSRGRTSLFRPPYGKLTSSQVRAIQNKGFKIVMWDVLSADFDTSISEEKCLENVLGAIAPGSVVVFHDSLKAEINLKYALPKVLKFLNEQNLQSKAIELQD